MHHRYQTRSKGLGSEGSTGTRGPEGAPASGARTASNSASYRGSTQSKERRTTSSEPAEPTELVIPAKRFANFPVFLRNNAMTSQQLWSVKEQVTAGGGDYDFLETSIPTCALLKLARQARDDL